MEYFKLIMGFVCVFGGIYTIYDGKKKSKEVLYLIGVLIILQGLNDISDFFLFHH